MVYVIVVNRPFWIKKLFPARFCDPCLTTFRNNNEKNDATRLDVLEEKYEGIVNHLNEIKSLCSKEPVVINHTPEPSTSSNPWLQATKLRIMKNGLNKANVSVLEGKIDPKVNKNITSHDLKDGTTILSCSSSTDVPEIQKIVQDSLPEHTVSLHKPSKSIIHIAGYKSQYDSDKFKKNYLKEILRLHRLIILATVNSYLLSIA